MESKATNFKFYTLLIDESTGATDIAQVANFIRDIDDKYNFAEEMASLGPLKGTNKSRDLY